MTTVPKFDVDSLSSIQNYIKTVDAALTSLHKEHAKNNQHRGEVPITAKMAFNGIGQDLQKVTGEYVRHYQTEIRNGETITPDVLETSKTLQKLSIKASHPPGSSEFQNAKKTLVEKGQAGNKLAAWKVIEKAAIKAGVMAKQPVAHAEHTVIAVKKDFLQIKQF